jgi:hypothetical protein
MRSTISKLAYSAVKEANWAKALQSASNIAKPIAREYLPAMGRAVVTNANRAGKSVLQGANRAGKATLNTANQAGKDTLNTANQAGTKYVIPGIKHLANRPPTDTFRPVADPAKAVFNPHIKGYSLGKASGRIGLGLTAYNTGKTILDADSRLPMDKELWTEEQKQDFRKNVANGVGKTIWRNLSLNANPVDRESGRTLLRIGGNKSYNLIRDTLIKSNNKIPLPMNKVYDQLYRNIGKALPEAENSSTYKKKQLQNLMLYNLTSPSDSPSSVVTQTSPDIIKSLPLQAYTRQQANARQQATPYINSAQQQLASQGVNNAPN